MKIRNIVFSGFMGAILATASNAAPTIASKNYVDSLVGARETVLQDQITQNLTTLGEHADVITQMDEDYQAADTAIRSEFAAADAATLVSANKYTDAEIDALEKSLSETGGNVGALTSRVTTNASNIAKNATAISDLTTTVTNNAAAAQQAVDNLANNAVATNTAAIATLNGDGEGSVAKSIADAISQYGTDATAEHQRLETKIDGNTTSINNLSQTVADNKAAAEKAVKDLTDGQVTTNKNDIATLMANAETTGSVDNKVATSAAQTKTAYETYAIPKPSDSDCDASSGLCVLSVSSDGTTLQWVDVTDAVVSEPDGGEEA